MDHSTMTMDMTATPTMNMPKPTASGGGMGGMGNGCKISMLFNLNTIDSCFLSSQWKITSTGMFAGSCIGVFLLGMALEFLRRSIKEYDRFLVRQHVSKFQTSSSPAVAGASDSVSSKDGAAVATGAACAVIPPFRPNVWQQGIRAFLHLLAFFVAYILMLLAMYYNGYLLLCIFLGSFFGAFIFQWETLPLG
ncbi:Ctr copper transporter family protein [Pochonia chlamydosporia 170]|uniref:Copper transport protein n=1 Tax=Pochonia chlamydosporia 170 TaxID=1380566 RepID=A0A179FAV5_METCM|nr:Ctr copper transporter family protein [Pochonia chlamydosporia 170]OAQ62665.1 Ctr copper transporter family protein [Pochonia chlamydosporia 170]